MQNLAVAGHYLAGNIGRAILSEGGNAIDAGVAMGIALSVLDSFQVQFAGVAPILIHHAATNRTVSIAGLGPWPKATDPLIFEREHRSRIPDGVLRTVVPAAPDAWITALRQFGTMSFADLAAPAIQLARDGFPAHGLLALCSKTFQRHLRRYPDNAEIWLPGGQPVKRNQVFVQSDLAATLQFMADQDIAAGTRLGREAGLEAARETFYRGDIGQAIVRHNQANGGWLAEEDMAAYRSPVESAAANEYRGTTIFSCGPWSQGPVLPIALNILNNFELAPLEHNSPEYAHIVTEGIKLAYADRERYFGDPETIPVPMKQLLDSSYAAKRAQLITPNAAWPGMPLPGDIPGFGGRLPFMPDTPPPGEPSLDTSVCSAIDTDGNMFAATPSDLAIGAPVVPGLGIVPSARGAQSYSLDGHAACVAPGKRPRLTACPTMAIKADGALMAGGGPGADGQPQAMLQVLLNHLVFGMPLQEAVAAPRFYSSSFPATPEPHLYFPGALRLDPELAGDTSERLAAMGHKVSLRSGSGVEQPAVCMLMLDPATNHSETGADPRLAAG